MKNKKILIIGGTGFIGYHLAKKCIEIGSTVTSFSTNKPKKVRFLKGVKYIKGDIINKTQLKKKLIGDFDYVVNLGGYVDHSNKFKTYASHFIGCKNLANLFTHKNIDAFVQMGSSMEYGKLKSPHEENKNNINKINSKYAQAKLNSTKFLLNLFKKKKFPVIILRLYNSYGPHQDTNRLVPLTILNSLKNSNFACTSGSQYRDFLYIDDLIEAIILLLKKKNKNILGNIFNIGSGIPIRVKDVVKLILKLVKKGKPNFGAIKMREDETLDYYPKIKKIKKTIKWSPKINLNDGIKRTIKFYKKNLNNFI